MCAYLLPVMIYCCITLTTSHSAMHALKFNIVGKLHGHAGATQRARVKYAYFARKRSIDVYDASAVRVQVLLSIKEATAPAAIVAQSKRPVTLLSVSVLYHGQG